VSNVTLFNGANLPAFAKRGELSETAKALMGSGGNGGKRISIKGGVFRLMVNGKEVTAIDERYLDVVIVKAAPKVARTFFLEQYDSDKPAAPDCWSNDGDTPDAKAKNPQAKTCATCPQNIAGSGTGQSRACRYQQRLAVVLANDVEGEVMQLALPATSIFGKEEGDNRPLQAYARWLGAQSVGADMVVTRMKFDTKSESPKLFFKAMRWLTDEEYAQAQEQGSKPEAAQAVVLNVANVDSKPADALEGAAPKAKAKAAPVEADEDDEAPAPAPKAAKKAKATPAPVEDDEDEAEPTVKKEAKKPSAVPAKKSLADVVGAWDDED
jgi:hypothetical protein